MNGIARHEIMHESKFKPLFMLSFRVLHLITVVNARGPGLMEQDLAAHEEKIRKSFNKIFLQNLCFDAWAEAYFTSKEEKAKEEENNRKQKQKEIDAALRAEEEQRERRNMELIRLGMLEKQERMVQDIEAKLHKIEESINTLCAQVCEESGGGR
jgi:hypothetical protein